MKLRRLLNAVKRPLGIVFALILLFAVLGCSQQNISDVLDIAGQLLEVSDVTYTEQSPTDSTMRTDTDIPGATEGSTSAKVGEDRPEDAIPIKSQSETTESEETGASLIDENGYYYTCDEVALYIYTYKKLPSNFITKLEAEDLGWSGGSVERYLDGAAIGGDKFSNREGLLPKKNGRIYRECDIDTNGGKPRGATRIIYSNDGLIYYTDNHYESFTLLYGGA